MITKILLFQTEHDAARGINQLKEAGFADEQIKILVADIEHSRLLDAETHIHIDLLNEIAIANRGDIMRSHDVADEHVVPYFVSQTAIPFPAAGVGGIPVGGGGDEQAGIASLIHYGISDRNARAALHALRAGGCIIGLSTSTPHIEDRGTSTLFQVFDSAFSSYDPQQTDLNFSQLGAVEVWDNK